MASVVEEALAMPVEKRAELADILLQSLNPIDPKVEEAWAKEAESRLQGYRAGQIKAFDVEESLEIIRSRLK